MVLAKINQLIEAPMQRLPGNTFDHYSFTNCIYQMLIVMTTVGYGDISNSTLAGKLLIFISAIFGVMVVSFFVTVITKKLDMTPADSRSFTLMNRLALRKQMEKKSASVIKIFFRLITLHRRGRLEAMRPLAAEMKIRLANLRVSRRKYNALIPEIQVNEDIFLRFERLQSGQRNALIALNTISKMVQSRRLADPEGLPAEQVQADILRQMVVPSHVQAEMAKQLDKARKQMAGDLEKTIEEIPTNRMVDSFIHKLSPRKFSSGKDEPFVSS